MSSRSTTNPGIIARPRDAPSPAPPVRRRRMDGRRSVDRVSRRHVVLTLVVVAAAACGADPYGDLTTDERRFVIPGSARWGPGEVCPGGGDCSGPIDATTIEAYDWFLVDAIDVVGDLPRDRSVPVALSVVEARSQRAVADGFAVVAWGPTVHDVQRALADGLDVWVGTDPDGQYVRVFAVFDDRGRVAALGDGAAEHFAVPVARSASAAGAESAFEHVDPLMAR